MRVLVAEDDPVQRHLIASALTVWGYAPELYASGTEAWEAARANDAPNLMILDWMMPGLAGVDICRKLRRASPNRVTYIILLTAKQRDENVVEGLGAGADDYIEKPFTPHELEARLRAATRIVRLQMDLEMRVDELETALAKVHELENLLPICSYCKKVRSDGDYWEQVERYFTERTTVRFSHGICPSCYEEKVEPELAALEASSPLVNE